MTIQSWKRVADLNISLYTNCQASIDETIIHRFHHCEKNKPYVEFHFDYSLYRVGDPPNYWILVRPQLASIYPRVKSPTSIEKIGYNLVIFCELVIWLFWLH